MLGVVVAGGIIGVALRELLLLPFAMDAADPAAGVAAVAATMGVNVAGSLLLGIVIGSLGDRHPLARAFLGTGVLGGFTTYSAFALHTATLLGPLPIAGIALAAASVLLGLAAAAIGLRVSGASKATG